MTRCLHSCSAHIHVHIHMHMLFQLASSAIRLARRQYFVFRDFSGEMHSEVAKHSMISKGLTLRERNEGTCVLQAQGDLVMTA